MWWTTDDLRTVLLPPLATPRLPIETGIGEISASVLATSRQGGANRRDRNMQASFRFDIVRCGRRTQMNNAFGTPTDQRLQQPAVLDIGRPQRPARDHPLPRHTHQPPMSPEPARFAIPQPRVPEPMPLTPFASLSTTISWQGHTIDPFIDILGRTQLLREGLL